MHYAGLLSIDLPPTIRKDEQFSVLVRQVTNTFGLVAKPGTSVAAGIDAAADLGVGSDISLISRTSDRQPFFYRKVLGAFQLTIPVHTKELLLDEEERTLSVLRWIAPAIPTANRGYRIFERYLSDIDGRVSGFGGDPTVITPSPTGSGVPGRRPKAPFGDERRMSFTGKVSALLFDRFGDFTGFHLDTEDGDRTFSAREHEIESLAQRAWADRILISVVVERHAPHRPEEIVLLHLPLHRRDHR